MEEYTRERTRSIKNYVIGRGRRKMKHGRRRQKKQGGRVRSGRSKIEK